MSREIKVKVSDFNPDDPEHNRTHEIRLRQAKALYQSFPIATKTWMMMRGFPMSWLNKHWNEITKY